MSSTSAVERARHALARHDWKAAYDEASLDAEVDASTRAILLDVRAEAAWWLGDLDACIAAREGAYELFDQLDDRRAAAQCAVWLYEHYMFRAQPAIAGAWLRRARQRLIGDEECVEYGNLVLREAEMHHGQGDLATAAAEGLVMVELGRRLRSPELEAQALQTVGRVLVDTGRTRQGLGYLDDAMLFAVAGRLGPYATGKIFCSLISACEELGDVARASEWIDATARWSERHPLALFPGLCRVHHAWALQCRGEWIQAEQEAMQACQQLAGISRAHAAAGYAELGEIRRRRGDIDGAEAAFRDAEALAGRPPIGLALLRLTQGRLDAAAAIVAHAISDEGWNRLARARILPAVVEIAVARGDDDSASSAADELDAIASEFDNSAVAAMASSARGRLLLARGDRAAGAVLRQAVERWQQLEVPYEVATARLLLAQAYRAAGDNHDAETSFAAAESTFAALGAKLDVRLSRDIRAAEALPAGLTAREVEVLRLVATGRTNKDIASTLVLSEKTVARHLSNIFAKIGVTSRSAATAFAFDHHLAGGDH